MNINIAIFCRKWVTAGLRGSSVVWARVIFSSGRVWRPHATVFSCIKPGISGDFYNKKIHLLFETFKKQ